MPLPLSTNVAPAGSIEVLRVGKVLSGSEAVTVNTNSTASVTVVSEIGSSTGGLPDSVTVMAINSLSTIAESSVA